MREVVYILSLDVDMYVHLEINQSISHNCSSIIIVVIPYQHLEDVAGGEIRPRIEVQTTRGNLSLQEYPPGLLKNSFQYELVPPPLRRGKRRSKDRS